MMCGDAVSSYFMLNWAHFNMDEIERRASGTIFLEISKQNFRPIPMVVPPTTVASRFDTSVKPLFDEIVANLRQAQSVTALRDTLLPKLLSGDIRVPDAERIVGRHV
jgi:type I restriction enzyme S subunit